MRALRAPFGQGIHYCLGTPPTRLEGQIAVGTALRRLPDLALAMPPAELGRRPVAFRAPARLPVTFDPGDQAG